MPCMPLTPCSLMALFCSLAGPALLVKASEPFILNNTSTSLPTGNVACPCKTALFFNGFYSCVVLICLRSLLLTVYMQFNDPP